MEKTMKKSEIIVIHYLSFEQLEQRFDKISRDFKEYKKEWVFGVEKNKNLFTISAHSKKKFIGINARSTDELAKTMKISVKQDVDKLILEKKFSYSISHYIIVKIIPWIIYSFAAIYYSYLAVFLLLGNNIDSAFRINDVILVGTSVAFCYAFWGAKKLEKKRLIIIEELLQRFIYDDKSK
jgi:hypothetical protein